MPIASLVMVGGSQARRVPTTVLLDFIPGIIRLRNDHDHKSSIKSGPTWQGRAGLQTDQDATSFVAAVSQEKCNGKQMQSPKNRGRSRVKPLPSRDDEKAFRQAWRSGPFSLVSLHPQPRPQPSAPAGNDCLMLKNRHLGSWLRAQRRSSSCPSSAPPPSTWQPQNCMIAFFCR